jgi:riboflavin synthase
MFTGIVTDLGTLVSVEDTGGSRRFAIACASDPASIALGASICCDGVCLTATSVAPEGKGARFTVDVSPETLARTTLGRWSAGDRINLERSLRIGDELGGHIVTGHVDGVAEIVGRDDQAAYAAFRVRAPSALSRFVAEKGSVALDGTSLTVNAVEGDEFGLMLIPHTLAVTGWGETMVGDLVNIEVDLMARYAARLAGR